MNQREQKVYENRLRRMAERQGLRLEKSRRRDPRAIDYERWAIFAGDDLVRGNLNIEQVEEYLTWEVGADSKRAR